MRSSRQDTSRIDHEFEQLQAEFQDVANTVQTLATKMQAAGGLADRLIENDSLRETVIEARASWQELYEIARSGGG